MNEKNEGRAIRGRLRKVAADVEEMTGGGSPTELTAERARTLVNVLTAGELYPMPAELQSAALVELVESLAAVSDAAAREQIARDVSAAAYSNTGEFEDGLEGFVRRVRAGAFDVLLTEERRRNEKGSAE